MNRLKVDKFTMIMNKDKAIVDSTKVSKCTYTDSYYAILSSIIAQRGLLVELYKDVSTFQTATPLYTTYILNACENR